MAITIVLVYILYLRYTRAELNKYEADVDKFYKHSYRPVASAHGMERDVTTADERYSRLKQLDSYEDYNSVAQAISVEPDVHESHAKYSKDMSRSASGASTLSVRDDPNDIVPWIGLRKPKYQEVYAMPGARVVHSEHPDQMRVASHYTVG